MQVNNAGMWSTETLQSQNLSELDKLYEINIKRLSNSIEKNVFLYSLVHFTQLAIAHLKKVKGTIVNVSTVASLRPVSNA